MSEQYERRAREIGFTSLDDLLHRLEAAEPRFAKIPSDSWCMELTVRLHHVYPSIDQLIKQVD